MVKCAWCRELIEGLLGSHIVGFQTARDCENFLASAERVLGAEIDRRRKRVRHREHSTTIRAYPVGVEWAGRVVRDVPAPDVCRRLLLRRLGLSHDTKLIVGVDRLDYAKGIPHKLAAIERLLESHPEIRTQCAFVQVAEPSRGSLPAYQVERAHVVEAATRVNDRFTGCHRPVHLIESHHEPADVYRLYRAADVCYVGSLRDGMNLVAKEFVCARSDERGVLVLSRYAGAAQQLGDALIVDPYDVDESADALARAIAMPSGEQAYRMQKLRANVAAFDARWWMRQLVGDALLVHQSARTDDSAEAVGRSMFA
jgi:trehalose 6-phosphate synthase